MLDVTVPVPVPALVTAREYVVGVLTANVAAHAPERRELVQALLAWLQDVRREPGLRSAHVYEDLEASSSFAAVSEWESEVEMAAHVRSGGFAVLAGALEVLGPPAAFSIARLEDGSAADAVRSIRRGGDAGSR